MKYEKLHSSHISSNIPEIPCATNNNNINNINRISSANITPHNLLLVSVTTIISSQLFTKFPVLCTTSPTLSQCSNLPIVSS